MINLIPQKAKKRLVFEYWIRVFSVWMLSASFVLLLGAGILLPTYVLIGTQIAPLEEAANQASQKVNNYENVSSSLIRASEQARYIKEESQYKVLSSYIDLFEDLAGYSIHLEKISMVRDGAGLKPIMIVGVADDRQSLASFRDIILAQEEVESANLPISNLARDKDIPFTITVTLIKDNDI